MARIVVVSSSVAHGHVGLSAAAPVLQRLGHEVIGLPSVILSNHPGWPHSSAMRMDPVALLGMLDALDANGWLRDVDACLTGYLPSPDHVDVAAHVIDRLDGARIVVDPVLGDTPKGLYIPEEAARAVRDHLVPKADILTPNAFELGWLTGAPVTDLAEARAAIRLLPQRVILTSAPVDAGTLGVLDGARLFPTAELDDVPHGVGDVFSALVATGLQTGRAVGMLSALIKASVGADHLRIAQSDWESAEAISPVT